MRSTPSAQVSDFIDRTRNEGYGISAVTVWEIEYGSNEEDRFILLGANHKLNILLVCHYFREAETRIRIISARKANKDEAHVYWSNRS